MLGDDLDPTVMTERFRFGTVLGHGRGGCELAREVRWSRSRGKRKPDWSGTVKKRKGGHGNYERIQVL